jgi:hypothetical protein
MFLLLEMKPLECLYRTPLVWAYWLRAMSTYDKLSTGLLVTRQQSTRGLILKWDL